MVRSASDSTPVIFLQQAFLCTLPRVRFLLTKCHWRVTPRCCLVRSCSWKQNAKAKTKRKEEASQKNQKVNNKKQSVTNASHQCANAIWLSVRSEANVLVVYCIFYLDIHSRYDIHWYKRTESRVPRYQDLILNCLDRSFPNWRILATKPPLTLFWLARLN